MGPDVKSSNNRLVQLRNIHADLLRKMDALESLRKRVQLEEKEREIMIAAGIPWTKTHRPRSSSDPWLSSRTRTSTLTMGPESLVGFLTILIYWRGGAGSEARCVIVPLQLVEPLFELGFFRSYFLIEFKSHCFMKFP